MKVKGIVLLSALIIVGCQSQGTETDATAVALETMEVKKKDIGNKYDKKTTYIVAYTLSIYLHFMGTTTLFHS